MNKKSQMLQYTKKKDHDRYHAVAEAKHRHAMRVRNNQKYRDTYNMYDETDDIKVNFKHNSKYSDKMNPVTYKSEKVYLGKKQNVDRPKYDRPKTYKQLDHLDQLRKMEEKKL